MEDATVAEAARLIAGGHGVEGLLTGQWGEGAQALRSLAAEVSRLIEAAADVAIQVDDAVADAIHAGADEALDSIRWECRSPDCEAPARGLVLDAAMKPCPACGGDLHRTIAMSGSAGRN